MWRISWAKRWCYDASKHRVGSVYFPAPSLKIYSYFTLAWKDGGITSDDAYYSDEDPRGKHHVNYPRWSHRNYWVIDMRHCAVKWTFCTNNYWKVGTIAYSDGSKSIYDRTV